MAVLVNVGSPVSVGLALEEGVNVQVPVIVGVTVLVIVGLWLAVGVAVSVPVQEGVGSFVTVGLALAVNVAENVLTGVAPEQLSNVGKLLRATFDTLSIAKSYGSASPPVTNLKLPPFVITKHGLPAPQGAESVSTPFK